MRLGIDATNVGGGGGITHLKEILNCIDDVERLHGIKEIIVFGSLAVLNELPNKNNLSKITFPQLNKNLLSRLYFQVTSFDLHIKNTCDILLSITGDYMGKFKPLVGMSRNMLLYERDIWWEVKQTKEIFRFWLSFKRQKYCFKNSQGIIFISNYAKIYANRILSISDKNQICISHGLSPRFSGSVKTQKKIDTYNNTKPFNFLYVSTVHVYKNQWQVVKAISNLRKRGYPVTLTLIGGVIFKPAGIRLEKTIVEEDPFGEFILNKGHVKYDIIQDEYKKADGIIFASNCENMPNILMESMASGVPILCSNKDPMPEFLKENGFYFDPKVIDSIENNILEFLKSPKKREVIANNNIEEIKKYTWQKTADDTFSFIKLIYENYLNI